MNVKFFLHLAYIFWLTLQVHCGDPCKEYKTCRDCVRSYPLCQWCSSDDYKDPQRCVSSTADLRDCSDVQNPKGFVQLPPAEDRNYSSSSSKITQIKPQRYKIKLRPGETKTFDFSFKAADDYPAELYFLLDTSYTMSAILTNIADASKKIYEEMQKITKHVLIGMGTFIDKNTAPFVRERLAPISSFSHKLNMTTDFNQFSELVNKVAQNVGTNHDLPEGGFDGIAQVIACQEKFNWGKESRKIVFFITDAVSHTAGDAKFAGIVYPYDGKCYTDDGIYTKELEMDYPSIGMINELAAREDVTIVFIVQSDVKDEYNKLKDLIIGSKCLEYVSKETESVTFENANLEKILTEIYEEITQNIELEINMTSQERENIKISFTPDCYRELSKDNPDCNVPHSNEKHFQGNVTLLRYFGKDNINLDITIRGIKEKVTLEIQVLDCDCKTEKDSLYCSSQGTKKCGVCDCNDQRTGKKCECKAGENNSGNDDESGCKPPNDKDALPCSGEGVCNCGICQCNKGRSGAFCECSSDSCVNGCNGHGSCYCGSCKCYDFWSGDACQCHEKPCKHVNSKSCNGRGDCLCGKCKCFEPANWDARDSQNYETCEMKPCTYCHHEQCLKLRDCAICRQSKNEEECSSSCGNIRVDVIPTFGNNTRENFSICEKIQAELGCYIRFLYQYDDINYKINLLVETEKDCLKSYYLWGGGVLLTLLLVGLLTLVAWKVLTELRDRREYQRFLKMHHADSDQGCQNPIYEPATTTIRNPAFRKPSVDYTLQ